MNVVQKGISSHLLKASAKRRRSKLQIKEEERQERIKEAEITAKIAQIGKMESDMAAMQQKLNESEEHSAFVHHMIDRGLLVQGEHGKWTHKEDAGAKHIRSFAEVQAEMS